MPLVLPVLLLLIMGAVTLASRSTNSFLAASKQSDAQAARQAAESGMNRVLRALSPYAKNAGDPYLSFLLLAKWENGKGVGGSGWALTQLGQGALKTRLQQCRISTRGMRETHLLPSSSQIYERLVSDVIGTTGNGKRTMRYRIVDYVPPQLASPRGWPSECSDFSTVTGGSAQITVEGIVEINGKSLASQRLTRTIEVDAVPFPDLPNIFPVPGPPNGLWIGDSGSGLATVNSSVYKDFEGNSGPVALTNTIGLLRPQCRNCSPSLKNGVTTSFPANASDLPPFPFDTDKPPFILQEIKKGDPANPYFPYTDSSLQTIDTRYCRKSEDLRSNIASEIDCWVAGIEPGANLNVTTHERPVNLIITGNVGDKNDASSIPPPPYPLPPTNYATLTHKVRSSGPLQTFTHTDPSTRLLWSRLRIFGLKPQPGQCSATQEIYIRIKAPSGNPSLAGAFVWLPRGDLHYGDTDDGNGNSYVPNANIPPNGYIDAPPEKAPDEFLGAWWTCKLTFKPTNDMAFLLPLYGNPEAMSALLPGGYFNASGQFIEDSRFPVYPALPRLRSTF